MSGRPPPAGPPGPARAGPHGISGPIASGGSGRSGLARVGGPISGCLGGCASVVMLVVGGLVASVFTVRDVVSTYLPGPARAIGLHWLADQPRPIADEQCLERTCCTLAWRQNGLSSAWYRVSCDAQGEVALSGFALQSHEIGGDYVYEDQRPMSGQVVELEDGRRWFYDGELAIGTSGLFPGARARRAVRASLVIERDGRKQTLQLQSAEPLLR